MAIYMSKLWQNLISKNSTNQWNSLYGNVLFAKKRRI